MDSAETGVYVDLDIDIDVDIDACSGRKDGNGGGVGALAAGRLGITFFGIFSEAGSSR